LEDRGRYGKKLTRQQNPHRIVQAGEVEQRLHGIIHLFKARSIKIAATYRFELSLN
jgi:hypothetical protein